MFSRTIGIVLAAGCDTAGAAGAYVASRHSGDAAVQVAAPNSATTVTPSQGAGAAAGGTAPAAQPVTETEAVVRPSEAQPAPKIEPAPPVEISPPATGRKEPPSIKPAAPGRRAAAPPVPAPAVPAPARRPAAEPPIERRNADPRASEPRPVAADPVRESAPALPAVEPAPRSEAVLPPKPAEPRFEEIILPSSSVIGLEVETSLTSERAQVEDRVDARVTRDVYVDGRRVISSRSRMIGNVTLVERGGKVKERARLGLRFHTLVLDDGRQVAVRTETIMREGEPPSGDSSRKIGGAAIGGAVLGAIIGGGKGAVLGGAAGAAGGTAAVMAGGRNAATLASGTIVTARLSGPVAIEVEKR